MKKLFLFMCLIAMIGLNSCIAYVPGGNPGCYRGRPYYPHPRYYNRGYGYNRYPAQNYGRRGYGYTNQRYNGGQYQGYVSPNNIQRSVPVVPGRYQGPRRR